MKMTLNSIKERFLHCGEETGKTYSLNTFIWRSLLALTAKLVYYFLHYQSICSVLSMVCVYICLIILTKLYVWPLDSVTIWWDRHSKHHSVRTQDIKALKKPSNFNTRTLRNIVPSTETLCALWREKET